MDWTDRLNEGPQELGLGGSRVELLNWSYAPHLPNNRPHRHTHFEVCQVGAYGRGAFLVEGTSHQLEPRSLFIARPGVLHQIVNAEAPNMELYWVSFAWLPGAAPAAGELDRWLARFAESPRPVVPDEGGQLTALWTALRAVAQTDSHPGSAPQLAGLMSALLFAVIHAGGVPAPGTFKAAQPEAARLRLATRYVHDNLDRPLPVSEVAAQLNLSPRQLARLFRQQLGVSPAAYIERARLERAQGLLQVGQPIKGVAAATGYESVHGFSRAFTRGVGVPPGRFRKRALQNR